MLDAKTRLGESGNADAEAAQLALLQAMFSHGANVNARADGIGTVLNYAIRFRNPRIVELLLQHGADPNVPDPMGETPLIWEITDDATNMAHLLLAHGANPNVQNMYGNTALHDALFMSNPKDFIPDLLAHGADPNLPNKQGETPLQMAQQANDPDLVRLMQGGVRR